MYDSNFQDLIHKCHGLLCGYYVHFRSHTWQTISADCSICEVSVHGYYTFWILYDSTKWPIMDGYLQEEILLEIFVAFVAK